MTVQYTPEELEAQTKYLGDCQKRCIILESQMERARELIENMVLLSWRKGMRPDDNLSEIYKSLARK